MDEIFSCLPLSIKVNAECLHTEFEIFQTVVEKSNDPCKTVGDFCQQAHFNNSIFPNLYKTFKLLFTAPVTIAKEERAFSRIKLFNTFCNPQCLTLDLMIL